MKDRYFFQPTWTGLPTAPASSPCSRAAAHAGNAPEQGINAVAARLIGRVFDGMGIRMRVEPGGEGMDANRFSANEVECVGVATGYAKNHTPDEFLVV